MTILREEINNDIDFDADFKEDNDVGNLDDIDDDENWFYLFVLFTTFRLIFFFKTHMRYYINSVGVIIVFHITLREK